MRFFEGISLDVTRIMLSGIFMVALWSRADHYIFALWFLLLLSSSSFFFFLFFPRLISAVTD